MIPNVPVRHVQADTHRNVIAQAVNWILSALNKEIYNYVSVTTTYTVLESDCVVECDGTFTVTLPADPGTGKHYVINNQGAGTITVNVASSGTINGSASDSLTTKESIIVFFNGSEYIILASK